MAGYIDVTIRHVIDLEEVIVSIHESASIRDLKEVLAEKAERPELMEVGEILRILPDGSTAPIKETMKIGIRRQLGFKGCSLHPPPPERPPPTLENFGEFDPDEEVIGSPRSLRACSLEGVAPEDLLYVPLESYQPPNIEPRIGELWYDFFEAIRQDALEAARATRELLIAEEEGKIGDLLEDDENCRVADTGGNWCGVLEQSRYSRVHQFFRDRNEMCNIDRIYKGATKSYRPKMTNAFFTGTASFQDTDPVLAGDTSDDASRKLNSLLGYYNSIPNSRKFVEEQRLVTKSNGIVQYRMDAKKLHYDQSEARRMMDARIDTADMQIAIGDANILTQMDKRRYMDTRLLESDLSDPGLKLPVDMGDKVTILGLTGIDAQLNSKSGKVVGLVGVNDEDEDVDDIAIRLPKARGFYEVVVPRENVLHNQLYIQKAVKDRAEFFGNRRVELHERQLDNEFARCERMKEISLQYQAIEERVHQHKSLQKLAFAREWTRRRVRWQMKNNAIVSNMKSRSQQILNKHQAATDRVDAQNLIRQKCIEYKREIRSLVRLHAELAAKREQARQDCRRDSLASELSRLSIEAEPSPSPKRRNKALTMGSLGSSTNGFDITSPAPYSNLLNPNRVVKRMARFDFPRMGAGVMSSSMMSASTSSMRQSNSMPSLGSSTGGHQQQQIANY